MIETVKESQKKEYNNLAKHPLQSWEWGEFRKQTGVMVSRFIQTKKNNSKEVFQVTWHTVPKTGLKIGYCPKSSVPDNEVLAAVLKEGKIRKAIFVKFEPNEKVSVENNKRLENVSKKFNWVKGKPLFTKYSFQLDISKNEEELLANMHQKTRYNLRLAEKKGVKIVEDNSFEGFEEYWKLMEETTKRQGFYAHTKGYHKKMWKEMTKSGMGHLFKAVYEGKTLTTWMIFLLNNIVYYPYGASSNENREVMANNLMMWEVINFGKRQKCVLFDMWGSMGPEPDQKDPWYGFHKFKQGYGAELVEFIGSYDLVVSPRMYMAYQLVDIVRWFVLKLSAKVRS